MGSGFGPYALVALASAASPTPLAVFRPGWPTRNWWRSRWRSRAAQQPRSAEGESSFGEHRVPSGLILSFNKPTASSHRLAVLCGKQWAGRMADDTNALKLRDDPGPVMFSAFFADQLPPHSCSTLSLVGNRRVGTQMRILVAGYVLLAVVQPSIAQSLPETEQPWAPDH